MNQSSHDEQTSSHSAKSNTSSSTQSPDITPLNTLVQPTVTHPSNSASSLIPYKNPQAIISYYVGLFALIPCFGLLFSLPAIVFGILALRAHRKNPEVKGAVHAWVGIALGTVLTLVWCGIAVGIIFALTVQQNPG